MVVCSHHFVGGKKTIDNPDPELHLIEKANKRPVQDKSGHERKRRCIVREKQHQNYAQMSYEISIKDMDVPESINHPQYTQSAVILAMKFVIYMLLAVIRKLRVTTYSSEQDDAINQRYVGTKFIRVKRHSSVHQSSIHESLIVTDMDANFFTGISTKSLLIKMHTYLSPFYATTMEGNEVSY